MKLINFAKHASTQPQVCQHCWSRAATTSSPNLCGDCTTEWNYLLECARNQAPTPLTEAACIRAEQKLMG